MFSLFHIKKLSNEAHVMSIDHKSIFYKQYKITHPHKAMRQTSSIFLSLSINSQEMKEKNTQRERDPVLKIRAIDQLTNFMQPYRNIETEMCNR